MTTLLTLCVPPIMLLGPGPLLMLLGPNALTLKPLLVTTKQNCTEIFSRSCRLCRKKFLCGIYFSFCDCLGQISYVLYGYGFYAST